MFSLKKALRSGVARKLINGVTAIGLVIFIIAHVLGNLSIFSGSEAFNTYSAKLHSLGPLFTVIEIGLLLFFVFHIVYGLKLWMQNRAARKNRYAAGQKSKGGPSHFNLSSVNMALSGIILAVFTTVHVLQFRFAAFSDASQYESASVPGGIDLFQMVVDAFANPAWVAFYCGSVFFLGWHLRHGMWSMLQTIGAMNDRWNKTVYGAGALIGILLAVAFFVMPLYIFFALH